jgi:hypothetical protein
MKIDVTQPIKEYDGRDVLGPDNQPVPIRTVLVNALGTPSSGPDPDHPGQQLHMTTESRNQRYALSTKLWSKKKVDLSESEREFIIARVYEAYTDNPLICGRVKQVLEGEKQAVPAEVDGTGTEDATDEPAAA